MSELKSLSWWEWLLCPTSKLKEMGYDSDLRVMHTGHIRPLSSKWAQTIGMWCLREPKEIMQVVAPGVDTGTARSMYDIFKVRHRTRTVRAFIKSEVENPDLNVFMTIGEAFVATLAHSRVVRQMSKNGLGPGTAAHISNTKKLMMISGKYVEEAHTLGLLPIEILLYYYEIERIFEESTMTRAKWTAAEDADSWLERSDYWKKHDCGIYLPPEALERYPVQ